MENTLYIALSHQMAAQRQMEVMANNIANATSPGFKGDSMMFVEHVEKAGNGQSLSFVRDRAVYHDLREGSIARTGNDLDVAIHGSGWFAVSSKDGELYTRNGHFHLDSSGRIVTTQGDAVLGDNGQPITLQPEDTDIAIGADGTVTARGEARGKLKLVAFDNDQDMRNVTAGLLKSDKPSRPSQAVLVQGSLEESNVEPIVEMTRMMEALRTYQQAQKLIDVEHERQRKAIDKLIKID